MTHLLSLSIHFILGLLPLLFEGDLISKGKMDFSVKEFKGASRTADDIDAIARITQETIFCLN